MDAEDRPVAFPTPILALVALSPGIDLAWAPKRGHRSTAEITVELGVGREASSARTIVDSEVLDVAPDGAYRVRTRHRDATLARPGELVRDDRPNERVTRYSRRGEILQIEKGDATGNAYRAAALTRLVRPAGPIAVGESWRAEWAPPPGVQAPPSMTVATLESAVGGLRRVSFVWRETAGPNPSAAKGAWTLGEDGEPLAMEAEVENYLGEAGLGARLAWRRL